MAELLTEEEQVELIKEWWKKNGTSVIVAIFVAVAAIYGYQYWQKSKIEKSAAAMQEYYEQTEKLNSNDKKTKEAGMQLAEKYIEKNDGHKVLSTFTALQIAKEHVVANEYKKAEEFLQKALSINDDKSLEPIIKHRLAQVNFATGNNDKALSYLKNPPESFLSLYAELEGDIYFDKGEKENAVASYKKAYSSNKEQNDKSKELIKIKLKNLGVDPEKTEKVSVKGKKNA